MSGGATKSRLLVTGANGFVGQGVCRRLAQDGFAVLGAVRSKRAAATLPQGVTPVVVEGGPATAGWEAALEDDISAVVHLIARAHHIGDEDGEQLEEQYRSVNVDITRALVEACATAGVGQLVYMSSIKAAGEGKEGWYTEADEPRPATVYGRTKLEAEHLVAEFGQGGGRTATIIRPPLVYGPGARGNFERLVSLVERGVPLPLGLARARRSLIALENLCDAVSSAIGHEQAQGIFHVADAEALEVRELIRRLADALGRSARLVPVPVRLLESTGALLGRSAEVQRLTRPLLVSTEKFRSTLQWDPPVDVDTALRQAVPMAALLGPRAG